VETRLLLSLRRQFTTTKSVVELSTSTPISPSYSAFHAWTRDGADDRHQLCQCSRVASPKAVTVHRLREGQSQLRRLASSSPRSWKRGGGDVLRRSDHPRQPKLVGKTAAGGRGVLECNLVTVVLHTCQVRTQPATCVDMLLESRMLLQARALQRV